MGEEGRGDEGPYGTARRISSTMSFLSFWWSASRMYIMWPDS